MDFVHLAQVTKV